MASQIAAGEVIERPASVVKELLDNALDAGATSITVELENGGIDLVRVVDDGAGIPKDELALAIEPHATSKIFQTGDLDHISTFGFRGEAMASIASVSRLVLRSRTREQDEAWELRCDGGEAQAPVPASGPVGTSITVRNLFYSTPARRKFLRTPQTERGRCTSIIKDMAMAHPAAAFRVVSDGKVLLDLEGGQSIRRRAVAVLGGELEAELLEVSADEQLDARGVGLWGLVGRPSIARGSASHQHIFVNGRPVRDRAIQHALKEAYRGLMEHSRYPTAMLLLEMTPEAVDVNVHPAKAEVRFRDSGLVHSVVYRAVGDALRGADLTPRVLSAPTDTHRPTQALPGAGETGWLVPENQTPRPSSSIEAAPPASAPGRVSFDALRDALRDGPAPETSAPARPHPFDDDAPPAGSVPVPVSELLQVHKSFVVTQDEGGLVIIDQHALHERAMFEYLLQRLERGHLQSQRLLTPAVVKTSQERAATLEELGPLFERIGIEAQQIGPSEVAVHAFPTFLFERNVEVEPFVKELLDTSEATGFTPSSEEAMREVVDMMSCKAAVKAGDRLASTELRKLVDLRDEVERSSSCPHGRPTTVRLSIRDLERLFHRG